MTVKTTLRASDYPNGTTLASISGWSVAGSGFTAQNGAWTGGGTALFNTGAAVAIGFADVADGVIVVPLSVAGASYPNIYFLQFEVHSDGNRLTFYDNNGGYTSNIKFLPGAGVPNTPRIGWFVTGNQIKVLVNGKSIGQYLNGGLATDLVGGWPSNSGGFLDTKTIPSAYLGGNYGGFLSLGGPNPPFFQLRDNADILLIDSVTLQRASPTQQKALVTFESNVTGATHVGISVLSTTGTLLLAEQSVAISAGSYTTGAIPSSAENGSIVIHARTLDGTASDQTDFTIFLPRTVVPKPTFMGNNADAPKYYGATSMFRDLTKTFIWKYNNSQIIPDWADTTPPDRVKASAAGYSANLLPIDWKGQTQITAPLSYQLDPEWVGVATQWNTPPGMWVQINNDPGAHLTLDPTGGHHVIVFDQAICNGRSISIIQNPALANSTTQPYGLPTTDYTGQFSWRLQNDPHPDRLLNSSFVHWWAQSGLAHIRHMKDMNSEEAGFARGAAIPSTRWTADHGAKLTDAMWTINYLGDIAIEVLVELHNLANKDLWVSFPRGCQESYVRNRTAYVRDHLTTSLKFIPERSNEVWNSAYGCYQGYAFDGFQKGLGKPNAVFGADNGSYWPDRNFPATYIPHNSPYDAVWVSLHGSQPDPYPPIAYTAAQYATSVDSSIYTCTTNVAAPTSLYTGTIPNRSDYVIVDQYYSALAAYLQTRANFYRANVEPQIDGAHWIKFQDYDLARNRAHMVEHQQMVAWIKDEMGAQASRVEPAVGVQGVAIAHDGNRTLEDYLVWSATANNDGTLNPNVTHFTGNAYFLDFKYDFLSSSTPSSVKNAAAGKPRQDAMIADILATTVPAVLGYHSDSAQALTNFSGGTNSKGKALSPAPILGVYEGGSNWQFANFPDAGSQAYATDVLALTKTRAGEYIGPLYGGLADLAGGRLTAFNDFYPTSMFDTYPAIQEANVWGFSDGVADLTSSPYVALRDVSLARGGALVDDGYGTTSPPPAAPTQRRRIITSARVLH